MPGHKAGTMRGYGIGPGSTHTQAQTSTQGSGRSESVSGSMASSAPPAFGIMRRTSFILTDTGSNTASSGGNPCSVKRAATRRNSTLKMVKPSIVSGTRNDGADLFTDIDGSAAAVTDQSPLLTSIIEADSSTNSFIQATTARTTTQWFKHFYQRFHDYFTSQFRQFLAFLQTRSAKNVLKCSLAYIIGCSMVYSNLGTVLYGRSDNKHLIATVCVYFHPARTLGSMIESIGFVVVSLLYSFIMATLSMVVSSVFTDCGLTALGYAIDLVVFCGFGLGFIAFKKRQVNRPTFNTACSLASIFLVTILTKDGHVQAGEFSFYKLLQSFMFVVSGSLISTVICLTLWPQSAVWELKKILNESMDYDAELLKYITERFLESAKVNTKEFQDLQKESATRFSKLETYIKDAKRELYICGREKEYRLLYDLVQSDHRLASHLGGLASSATTQWYLLTEDLDSDYDSVRSSQCSLRGSLCESLQTSNEFSTDSAKDLEDSENSSSSTGDDSSSTSNSNTPQELFNVFVGHLGPPMRAFYVTLRAILDKLPFENEPPYSVSLPNTVKTGLAISQDLYSRERERALKKLYNQDIFKQHQEEDGLINKELAATEEAVAASCGNFSYVLEDYGRELSTFIDTLERYCKLVTAEPAYIKTWDWLKLWRLRKHEYATPKGTQVQTIFDEHFMSCAPHLVYTPADVTTGFKIWKSLAVFRRIDVLFGIKVGLGAMISAIPAFLPSMRPLFQTWRGEWGIVIYTIIMNKSVGGTTSLIPARIIGTLLGAATAAISWSLFPGDPYLLAFIGWCLSLRCFWIILHWKSYNPFGRFILLTFNLTVLYSYSISSSDNENDDDEGGTTPIVWEIAFHRFVSVIMGILWALFITTVVWPNSARTQLKHLISNLWIKVGFMWKNDVFKTFGTKNDGDLRFVGISQRATELHNMMTEINSLVVEAANEFRLKGPFPVDDYKALTASTQAILDAFKNIDVLLSKYPKPSPGELELMEYTYNERQELCSRIFLLFYLESAAIRLNLPLPDKLPSTDHALDRMLAKLNTYRQTAETSDEEDFVLFYTYILVTITITEELSKMSGRIHALRGAIELEI